MSSIKECQEKLDEEWLALIMTAKQMGFTIKEIRSIMKEWKNHKG